MVGSINYKLAVIYLKQIKNMSMKYKFFLVILFMGSTTLFTSCIKDNLKYTQDEGKTFLKFLEAPEKVLYFTPFSTIDTVSLFSIRRDANSSSSLKTPVTVTLTSLPDFIDQYNTDNGTAFELLPDSIYTLSNPSYVKTATGFTLNLKEGDFASEFDIALNGAKWDVAHTYAAAFSLSATGNNLGVIKALDTMLVFLSVKNKYDGAYALRIKTVGWGAYGIADGVTHDVEGNIGMITSGPNTLTWDVPNQIAFTAAGDATGFGATAPQFTFDLATDKLTDVTNLIPNDGRNRQFRLNTDISDSRYDSDKKVIYAAYIMSQNGRPDQFIYDTLTYKQPR